MGPGELRQRREALRLSQAALAQTLGLSRNTVARWERGELEIQHAELLSIALSHLEAQTPSDNCETPVGAPHHNLPEELTSFVGREHELNELRQLLSDARLVTLVGVGGVGKTRLATRLAHLNVHDYRDGVWFVDLAALTQPGNVARTVAAALGFSEEPARPGIPSGSSALAKRQSLILLDNCEHLLEESADFVASLLRAGNAVRVLATSREPLGLTAERVFRLQPLPVLEPRSTSASHDLLDIPAVKLLIDRARSQSANISPNADAQALAEICWRLDGLPLALELVAPRLIVLSPIQVAHRLADGLGVLGTGPRDATPRQHSIRAALEWSHALLSAAEQRLFARLAVFAGGWTLEACEGVAGFDEIDPACVLELLSNLIAKSLVLADAGPEGTLRYRFLETVRQYACEQLERSVERDTVRARHIGWYLRWVERMSTSGRRPLHAASALHLVNADLENLRLALDAATSDARQVDEAIMAAGRLWWFWLDTGRAVEGYEYTRELLCRAGEAASPASRAAALRGAGLLSWHLRVGGGLDDARQLLEQAVAIRRQLPDASMLANYLGSLARPVRDQGDRATAERILAEALHLAEPSGNRQTVARALHGLGTLRHEHGDYRGAIEFFERSLRVSRAIGDHLGVTTELQCMAMTSYLLGDLNRAAANACEVLELRHGLGARAYIPGCIFLIAGLAARLQRPDAAARLSGAAARLAEQVDVQGRGGWNSSSYKRIQKELGYARIQIGPARFASLVTAGGCLTLEEAVSEALGLAATLVEGVKQVPVRVLTRREMQVAGLVARGLTNRQIAVELVVSESTASKHVEHIRDKFGFASRAQIAAYVASSS